MKNKTYFYSAVIAVFLPGLLVAETLHEVAVTVLLAHPDILREQANVSSVEQARQGAIGDYLPTLDLTGAIGHETSYEKNLNGSDVNLTRSELSLVFNQNLFKGFGSDAEYDRQAARHKAAAF
ncbi:MAG: TolC family protein, partial [Methylococcales bacterium]